jgi:hypothetical protein
MRKETYDQYHIDATAFCKEFGPECHIETVQTTPGYDDKDECSMAGCDCCGDRRMADLYIIKITDHRLQDRGQAKVCETCKEILLTGEINELDLLTVGQENREELQGKIEDCQLVLDLREPSLDPKSAEYETNPEHRQQIRKYLEGVVAQKTEHEAKLRELES